MAEKKWLARLTETKPGQDIDYGGKSFATTQRRVEEAAEKMSGTLSHTGTTLHERYRTTYAWLYQTQPNARTAVDFISRNIAQLGWKVYDRKGDATREYMPEHPADKLLRNPNPYTTPYRFKRDIASDLAIYDNAFVAKVRTTSGTMALVRIPPSLVQISGKNVLHPDWYVISPYGDVSSAGAPMAPEDMIHFRGYDPEDGRAGFPPFETLRRVLAQDEAADRHMDGYWEHAPRREGIIERPIEAGDWSEEAAERFRKDLVNHFSGGANAGVPLILEDGMTWKSDSFDPKTVQWSEGRKLNLETVARAYHIPVAMMMPQSSDWGVGEYHEMLYSDTLAPQLAMIQEELKLQLLSEFEGPSSTVYIEFNLDEKLRGDFKTKHQVLTSAVGGPYMTANEARAMLNMPPVEGGDELRTTPGAAPATGEPDAAEEPEEEAAPTEDEKKARGVRFKALGPISDEEVGDYARDLERGLRRNFERQRDAHRNGKAYDKERWDRELADDLYALSMPIVERSGKKAAELFEASFVAGLTKEYVQETSRIRAEKINGKTAKELGVPDADPSTVYGDLLSFRTLVLASTAATALSMFATHEAAKQAGVPRKTWNVTNAKSRHPQMHGETVPVDEPFSNGAKWPADPILSADETAHCQCVLSFTD